MSYPLNFLSRFILPKSHYHFSLIRPDFRINFCLNSGSLSYPTSDVPIYRPLTLNDQMNQITTLFLRYCVHTKRKGTKNDVQVTLPRICQWFANDFGPDGSPSEVLYTIESYLNDEKKRALASMWNPRRNMYDIGVFNLKYLPFSYECRFLTASRNTTQ